MHFDPKNHRETVGLVSQDDDEDATHLARAWRFAAALDLASIIYLLAYVFRPEVMTADKLFGAAAAYLMICSFWGTLYALTDLFYPGYCYV